MKQLRILTGHHAGVRLPLKSAVYTIGAGDESDLQITDWAMPPIVLESDAQGVVTIKGQSGVPGAPKAVDGASALADFTPQRFGDVVLCVGPEQDAWPSDVELMRLLMQPPAATVRKNRAPRLLAVAAAVLVLAVGVSAGIVSQTRAAHTPQPAPLSLVVQVEAAVQQLTLSGVKVTPSGDKILVQGLLGTASEADALRRHLARFPADRIEHRYASSADIGTSISDALAQPRLAVSYLGDGVFQISGEARDLVKTREAVARLAVDLAPLVKRIDVAARAAPPTERLSVGAALASGGMQYVQTRDGAKHLSMTPESSATPEASPTANH